MYYTYYLYNTYNTVFCIVVPCVRTLDEDGAVLLDAVMDAPEAQSMRAYYYDRFLPAVDDAMVELAALNKTSSFYVAERSVEGVRVRACARSVGEPPDAQNPRRVEEYPEGTPPLCERRA